MTASSFLAALHTAATDLRHTVHTQFAPLSRAQLNQRPAAGGWSVLECLEHLNRYSCYYLPALEKAISTTKAQPKDALVSYSWLGRKSVEMMRPSNLKKQTTLKHMNPLGSQLSQEVLTEFDQHQARLLHLLNEAQHVDLNRKAVPIEFFRLLKLQLGEALEFVVVHQQRHVQQAQRVHAPLPQPFQLAC